MADKYAARYEQALSKERTSETETLVNQRDVHTRAKDTDLEKYGSVTELKDALVGGTHIRTLQLTFEDTSAGPPFSIFKQCNDRVLKLYRVHQVRTWLLSFNIQMPQLPLLVARLFEQQLITLANAADQFDSEAKVRAEKFSALDRSPYEALIRLTKNHCEAVMNHAYASTVLQTLPAYCPDAVNPARIALRQGIEEATARLEQAPSHQLTDATRRPPASRANQRRAQTPPAGQAVRFRDQHPSAPRRDNNDRPREDRPTQLRRLNNGDAFGPRLGLNGPIDFEERRRLTNSQKGCFVANDGARPSLPTGLSVPYCLDYLFVGRACNNSYQCRNNGRHVPYARMPEADRNRIDRHISETRGLSFSATCAGVPPNMAAHVASPSGRSNGNRG